MLDMTVILSVPEREKKFFFASFIEVLTGFFLIASTVAHKPVLTWEENRSQSFVKQPQSKTQVILGTPKLLQMEQKRP